MSRSFERSVGGTVLLLRPDVASLDTEREKAPILIDEVFALAEYFMETRPEEVEVVATTEPQGVTRRLTLGDYEVVTTTDGQKKPLFVGVTMTDNAYALPNANWSEIHEQTRTWTYTHTESAFTHLFDSIEPSYMPRYRKRPAAERLQEQIKLGIRTGSLKPYTSPYQAHQGLEILTLLTQLSPQVTSPRAIPL